MRRGWPLVVLAVAVAAVAAVVWHRRGDAAPRSVLLITIDTLRADAVGDDTPAIRAFLAGATRFTRVRTPVPLTLPAHVTLLSGLAPRRHGVHENLVPPLRRARGYSLLAEEFHERGYATAAFVSSAVVGPATGLDAGFDVFESPNFKDSWSGEQGDLLAPERLIDALKWLAGRDQPYFLWVHFFDPHVPYLPFPGDARREATAPGDPPRALYAGEVRRADAAVERLLAAIDPETIVVIASDHGEGLGEHGENTHGVLCYGATLDVFLAVRAPGLPAGKQRGLRGLADVAPTLRALCRMDEKPSDGVSLLDATERVVVSESLWSYRKYGWAQVFCATDGRFSLVESGPTVAVFDLVADPGETKPLEPVGHEAYERLDRPLHAYRATAGQSPHDAGAYVSAGSPYGTAVRPLFAYLPRPKNARLADPADGFPFARRMNTVRLLIHRGKAQRDAAALRQAIGMLRALAESDPQNPAPHLYLVHAQGRLGWLTGNKDLHIAAARSAKDAIDRGYTVAPLLHDLLYESLYSESPQQVRAALEIAWNGRIVPDRQCANLAAKAGEFLAQHGDRKGADLARQFLERYEQALKPG